METEPNNGRADALARPYLCGFVPLLGQLGAGAPEDPWDFFALVVPRSGTLVVELGEIPPDCDYDLRLYDSDGQFLASSERSGREAERIEQAGASGLHFVQVFPKGGVPNRSDAYYRLVWWEIGAPTPTPPVTATATPESLSALCGGFEDGAFVPCWHVGGELGWSVAPTLDLGEGGHAPPYAGRYSALLGNPSLGAVRAGDPEMPAGSAWFERRIWVPDRAQVRLVFQYRVISYDVMLGSNNTLWDSLDVTIDGTLAFRDGSRRVGGQGTRDDGGWREATVDLAPWLGREATIRFAVWNREYDGNGTDLFNTWAFVDEVVVE